MLDALNKHMLIRRFALLFVLGLTAYAYRWGFDFATLSPRPGGDIAMILGAILGPLTTLQGFIFKFYSEARTALQSKQSQ